MKSLFSLMLLLATIGCGSNNAVPSTPTNIAFGQLDASVDLGANANTLSQDYDAGGIAMYKALAAHSSGNMIFSAFAVQTAMGMMYAGAQGSTATNIAQALNWQLSPTDLPAAHKQLTTVIATDASASDVTLETGTRIWVDKALGLKSAYAATLADAFGADASVQPLGTNPEGSRSTINSWASQQTHNLIPELLPTGSIDANTLLVQTAALYFKAAWRAKFEPKGASLINFTNADGNQSMVHAISSSDVFSYVDANNYQAIDLDYGQGDLALLIVMPKSSWDDFEQSLSGAFVHEVLAGLSGTPVDVVVPVLNLQQTPDMTQALEAMGLSAAMSEAADFGLIGEKEVSITGIYEQAVLTLDENGTEAAAAAAVVGSTSTAALDPGPTQVSIDHPFFFAIHDARSGTPLFVGRVTAL